MQEGEEHPACQAKNGGMGVEPLLQAFPGGMVM
jgi:hypothetical protein